MANKATKEGSVGHWDWTTRDDGMSYLPSITHDTSGWVMTFNQGQAARGTVCAGYALGDEEDGCEEAPLPDRTLRSWLRAALGLAAAEGTGCLDQLADAVAQLYAAVNS